MRTTVGCTFFWVLLGYFCSSSVAAIELPDLIDTVRSSVVGVGSAYPPRQPVKGVNRIVYSGTGFVVGDGRHVITNLHVLDTELDRKNRERHAIFAGLGSAATTHFARVVARDPEHDLVLLKFSGPALPALDMGDSAKVREGQSIAFTGFPIGMALGLHPVTHRGIVAAILPMAQAASGARNLTALSVSRLRSPERAFQLDAIAYPGNSGSPVFELESGRVVGVINSVLVKETRESAISSPTGISYAVPIEHARKLLDPASWERNKTDSPR